MDFVPDESASPSGSRGSTATRWHVEELLAGQPPAVTRSAARRRVRATARRVGAAAAARRGAMISAAKRSRPGGWGSYFVIVDDGLRFHGETITHAPRARVGRQNRTPTTPRPSEPRSRRAVPASDRSRPLVLDPGDDQSLQSVRRLHHLRLHGHLHHLLPFRPRGGTEATLLNIELFTPSISMPSAWNTRVDLPASYVVSRSSRPATECGRVRLAMEAGGRRAGSERVSQRSQTKQATGNEHPRAPPRCDAPSSCPRRTFTASTMRAAVKSICASGGADEVETDGGER